MIAMAGWAHNKNCQLQIEGVFLNRKQHCSFLLLQLPQQSSLPLEKHAESTV